MHIRGYHRDITPADVDKMGKHLLAGKAMHEREIALSQQVAEALKPIAHYTTINVRVTRVIESAIPDSRARISHTRNQASWQKYPEWVHVTVSQGHSGPNELYTRISERVDIHGSVADLIVAFKQCETSRQQLEHVTNQFTRMEEIIDAEEHIRSLVKEIEETRKRLAKEMLGTEGNYWHDAVREHLPTLAGER